MLAALAFTLSPVRAQDEPAKDHPMIPRFPGFVMESGKETDFDEGEFPVGEEKTRKVEGRNWQFNYVLKEGARRPSGLEVIRNYENQFKARGGRLVYKDPGNTVAGLVMPAGKGERWLSLMINNDGEMIIMNIIETAGMKQKVEFNSDQMAEELAASGKVVLRGILFDTGKTDIKPESDPLLEQIIALLKTDADLKLRIEGHTDNVGAKAANLTLSKGRAAAVKTALVGKGIDAGRLSTEGFGDSKPVADNATDDGRAQNRRVELVKQ
jgi:outer membrane protein OmpA-like peptidoglycan-associated protein